MWDLLMTGGRRYNTETQSETRGEGTTIMRSAIVLVVCLAAVTVAASCARLGGETSPSEEPPGRLAPAYGRVKLECSILKIPDIADLEVSLSVFPKSTQPTAEPTVLDGDTPVTKEKSTSATEDRRKRVHFATTLIVFSDADARKVGAYAVAYDLDIAAKVQLFGNVFPFDSVSGAIRSRPAPPEVTGVSGSRKPAALLKRQTLGYVSSAKLKALLKFMRERTQSSFVPFPQFIVMDDEPKAISLDALLRLSEAPVEYPEGGSAGSHARAWRRLEEEAAWIRPGTSYIKIIPKVVEPDNSVILTVLPKMHPPQEHERFETFDGGPLGPLRLPPPRLAGTPLTQVILRSRQTVIVSGIRAKYRGEEMSVLLAITPTVIDFEKRSDPSDLESDDGPAAGAPATRAERGEAPLVTRVYTLGYVGHDVPARIRRNKKDVAAASITGPLVELLEVVKSDRGTVSAVKGAPSVSITDTPEKLAAMEKLLDSVGRPRKQIHLSVKLIALSDADAATVSTEHLPEWRPARTQAPKCLGTIEFAKLQGFLRSIKSKTRGAIMQAPQHLVFDNEEATLDFEESWRYAASFVQDSTGARGMPRTPFKLELGPRFVVIPQVSGPNNDVALSIAAATAKSRAKVDDDSPDTLERAPTNAPSSWTKARMRNRETVVIAVGRGERRGEKINALVMVTPTVVDYEWKVDTPLETTVFQLAYVRPDQTVYLERNREAGAIIPVGKPLIELLEDSKSDRGKIVAMRKGCNALIVTDTPEKLAAMEKLVNEADRPPKQVYLSIKVIMLPDADVAKVRAESLSEWRPGKDKAPGILKTFDFAEMQAFFRFVRDGTRGVVRKLPGTIALTHAEVTIDFNEKIRYEMDPVVVTSNGARGWRRNDKLSASLNLWLGLIPHVTGPDNEVILTVVPGTQLKQVVDGFRAFKDGKPGQSRLPKSVASKDLATHARLGNRETVVVAGGRGEWQGEKINVLVTITPTVIDFEKRSAPGDSARR